jgi:CRISPR-associated protein Csh1
VYNFLVDAGCLENGWKMPLCGEGDTNMSAYKSEDEFFEVNKNYFDTNEKKAWFVLGRLYNAMIWESKKYYKHTDPQVNETGKEGNDQYNGSYLEKNFFFGRKYDWDTFLYFANQCFDLSVKYGALHKKYIKEFNSRLKEFMVPAENKNVKLSPEEAKYIFAWGMSQWFEIDKEHINSDETETAENEIKENEDGAEVPEDNEETNEDGEN